MLVCIRNLYPYEQMDGYSCSTVDMARLVVLLVLAVLVVVRVLLVRMVVP